MKRYQLHYYWNENKTKAISISWGQGLVDFKAKYQGEIFFESPNIGELRKGTSVFHDKLGNVFIRMCTHPIGFEVKVGDLYLENSRILAQESLGTVSAIWIFIGVISTLGSLGFAFLPGMLYSSFGLIILGLLLAFSIFYIVAGVLIRKGQIWAYYASLALFTLATIFYFQETNIVIIGIRIIVIGVVLWQFKNMQDLYKHRKAKNKHKHLTEKNDLLDNL